MFYKYSNNIKLLKSFEKEDILNETFELYSNDNMKVYYAPHNEFINEKAKIFIVGITPGWTQTQIAYKTAYQGLIDMKNEKEIKKECKRNSRFAGSMRKNLVEMLNELTLNKFLNIESCAELFEEKEELLHTTSIIPYPVFINGKNYTGSNPKIMDSEVLYSYVKKYFYKEVTQLSNALIIPLGKAVEEVIEQMIIEGIIKKEQCLLGFPHPSGANGHRKRQFEENKNELIYLIKNFSKMGVVNMNTKKYLGQTLEVKIDRPFGTKHPKHGFIYPVNYGYVPNTVSGDGEELDCYVLGVFEPVDNFKGKCIAIIHRTNDNDDKLIIVPEDRKYSDDAIEALVEFQERFFEHILIR